MIIEVDEMKSERWRMIYLNNIYFILVIYLFIFIINCLFDGVEYNLFK